MSIDLSNLEIGNMKFNFNYCDAIAICNNVIDTVNKVKQTQAELRFNTSLPSLKLYTDDSRLQQLLINLLINATKFTPQGNITLEVQQESKDFALFSVTDTGCGIPLEKQSSIFNRFEKLNEGAQGTGLGLSICQLIIERIGGKIWIDPNYTTGAVLLYSPHQSHKARKGSTVMKRLLILFIIAALAGGTTRTFAYNTASAKDSLLQVLDTLPVGESRFATLYSLAYLDPMSPSCVYYLGKLLDEATQHGNKYYQCLALYAHVVYYYNHQDEENTASWMDKLAETAIENKQYDLYFEGKRAEITIYIIKHQIEYSITQAEEMFKLAQKLNSAKGMSSAKLCLMTAYLSTARFKEGEEAGFEAYRLLPPTATLESRKSVLQEIALACYGIKNKDFLAYLQEYQKVLDTLSDRKNRPESYSYLLLESLYADYFLNEGKLEEARLHLKKMDEYFSPTTYIPCRGLYYNVYAHYYRIIKEYDKALACSQNAIELLSAVTDDEGLRNKIAHAGILTDAGQADKAIPLFQSLLAKKDSFYRALSISQTNEIYQMRNMDNLLLEKEQYKAMVHYAGLGLIAIALLILTPSVIRIYYVRKKLKKKKRKSAK